MVRVQFGLLRKQQRDAFGISSYLLEPFHGVIEGMELFLPHIVGKLHGLVRENNLKMKRRQEAVDVAKKSATGRCPCFLNNAQCMPLQGRNLSGPLDERSPQLGRRSRVDQRSSDTPCWIRKTLGVAPRFCRNPGGHGWGRSSPRREKHYLRQSYYLCQRHRRV